jgi:hypothetical protein
MKKKIILSILGVVILIILAGVLLFPCWMEQYLEKQVIKIGHRIFGQEIIVDNVKYDMWNCRTIIHQITVPNAPGFSKKYPAITISKIDFNFAPLDIFKNKLHIEKLLFDGVIINVELRRIPLSLDGILDMLFNKEINLLALKNTQKSEEIKDTSKVDNSKAQYIQLDQLEILNTKVSLVNLKKLKLIQKKFRILEDKNLDSISLPDYKISNIGKDRQITIDELMNEIIRNQYKQIKKNILERIKTIKKEVQQALNNKKKNLKNRLIEAWKKRNEVKKQSDDKKPNEVAVQKSIEKPNPNTKVAPKVAEQVKKNQ